jgi:radical SAM superfamily enzyme YgiQ (UPF0313 family)
MIVLTTLNARYSHAALGLRYLLANLGELQAQTEIAEFVVTDPPEDVVERLLARAPRIVGLGVYIWNAEASLKVAGLLKRVAPEVLLVLGGPEVSHETGEQAIAALADHVIAGPADLAFAELCRQLLRGERAPRLIQAEPPPLDRLALPYRHYGEDDIAHRVLYVEASRGCPFTCEFCLSALDKTAKPFPLERFLEEMHALYARGARRFKFVDRTFNLNPRISLAILEFFLERLDERLFLHFEMIPDHLPERLKQAIAQFPPGSLQLEIGIQTFDGEVQARIGRRQDNAKTEANLRWLRQHSHAHLHTDLILGLPGEDLATFGASFDRLVALDPHEIQVGILKRLRGAPIARHSAAYDLRYSPAPPYTVLSSDRLSFAELQRMGRFARYWDLIGNSGRFVRARRLLLGEAPFGRFLGFSDWLYATLGRTHQIAADRLYDLVHLWLIEHGTPADQASEVLARDFRDSGMRSVPAFLQHTPQPRAGNPPPRSATPARQLRHVQAGE